MRFLKTKLFTLLTLMLCMGVFTIPALASDGDNGEETLTVTAAWVDGELLRINVTDVEGVSSALALRLSDYVNDSENKEYISIQAIDLAGNKSGVIEIKNPYYDPADDVRPTAVTEENPTPAPNPPPQSSISDESKPADGLRPFTPDGTGTVVDNATDGDGKEFFTVGTEDGGVFYLIVDRQKNADNVYLLNTVTEQDLIALAEKNGKTINTAGGGTSAIETPEQPNVTEGQNPPVTPSPEPNTESPDKPTTKNDATTYILIGAIVIVIGGAGYYFKIVKGKKNAAYDDDDEEDEDDYGYSDEAGDSDDDAEDGGDDE